MCGRICSGGYIRGLAHCQFALFFAELIQGLGHIVSMKWVIEGEVNTGTFCTAQGVLQQLGETGAAIATLAIAVQTFVTIWWLKNPSKLVALISVGMLWLFVIVFVAVEFAVNTNPPDSYYATPTPYWCWIGQRFSWQRIAGEYVWFWLTLFISIALYFPLYLLHREVIRPGKSWYAPSEVKEEDIEDRIPVVSTALSQKPSKLWTAILYPILYCVITLPLSVARWIEFRQEATGGEMHISPTATFICGIIFTMSGVFNAVMYLLTRTWLFRPEQRADVGAPLPHQGHR